MAALPLESAIMIALADRLFSVVSVSSLMQAVEVLVRDATQLRNVTGCSRRTEPASMSGKADPLRPENRRG